MKSSGAMRSVRLKFWALDSVARASPMMRFIASDLVRVRPILERYAMGDDGAGIDLPCSIRNALIDLSRGQAPDAILRRFPSAGNVLFSGSHLLYPQSRTSDAIASGSVFHLKSTIEHPRKGVRIP